jgi:type I restriction enzyme, S subunit
MNKQKKLVPKLRFPEFQGGEGWGNAVLGDLSEVVRGGSPRPIDGFLTTDANGLNWLKIGDVDKEAKYVTRTAEKVRPEALGKTRVVKPGDLILSNSMSFGRPYILQVETCIHDGWIAVTDIVSEAARDFLYYSISAPDSQSYFTDNAAGSGVQNLNADIIKALPVRLPKPAEQQKIADFLSSLDELIAAQARKVEALKTHKKGLMQQLFPREGETQPRLRFPEFRDVGEWTICELGSVSDVRDGTHDSPSFFPTGWPLVTSKNLRPDGTLDLVNVSLISEEDYLQINKRSRVTIGDILFGMIGTIGNPVLVKSEGFAIKNVALIKEIGALSNTFLVQLLQSGYVAAIFSVLNTGNSQKFIALGKIRGLPIPVPSLREQKRIADCLTTLDSLGTIATQELEALKTHRKGLMQQLFPQTTSEATA